MQKNYKRNPDPIAELERLNAITRRVGELDDRGCKVPDIQRLLDINSRSSIEHHKKVYRLFKRANQNNISDRVKVMLDSSGLKFCNCGGKLLNLPDEEFITVLEYIANPANININVLKRDDLTEYVKKVIIEKPYLKPTFKDSLHDKLKNTVARTFLHGRGIPSSTEVSLEFRSSNGFKWEERGGLRIDVAGFDQNAVYGIEVKTNLQDFEDSIDTLLRYSEYLDYIYVFTSDLTVRKRAMECLDEKFGIIYFDLVEHKVLLEYSREPKMNNDVNDKKRNELKYRIMKKELNKYLDDSMKIRER